MWTGKWGLSEEEGTQMSISYLENTTLFACIIQLTVTSVMDPNEYVFVISGNG